MHLIKSLMFVACLTSITVEAKDNTYKENYKPKEISISYSDTNLTINQGKSTVHLPAVKINTIERNWNIGLPNIFTNKNVFKHLKQLVDLSTKFGFKLDANYLALFQEVNEWLGTRYKYASQSKKGIDCSGFTNIIYNNVFNKTIDRISRNQALQLKKVVDKDKLQPGNLVFFGTNKRNRKRISHVGIYLGSGFFAHASTKKGVTIDKLDERYYATTYITGGEI